MTRILLVFALLTAGCDKSDDIEPDQCMRREIFRECMGMLPAGPVRTHYNDWSEVVDECESAAYFQSLRQVRNIKAECR